MSVLPLNTRKVNFLFDSSYKKTKITLTASIAIVAISLLARIYQNRALFLVREEINNYSAVSFAFMLYLLWDPRGDYLCNPEQLIKKIIEKNEVEKLKVLIKINVNVNAADRNGIKPLDKAIKMNRLKIAKLLIKNKAEASWENAQLYLAIAEGQLEEVQDLINVEANLKAADPDGNTPLHWAVHWGQKKIVKLLIENRAKLNAANNAGNTPLHWAANRNQEEIAKLLIETGAGINAANIAGNTPLHIAVYLGHEAIAKLLIANNADLNAKNNAGNTPHATAIKRVRLKMINLLQKAINDKKNQEVAD